MVQSLHNTKKDWIITGVLLLVALTLVALAFFTAPIRHSSLTAIDTPEDVEELKTLPRSLTEVWRVSDASSSPRPLTVGDRVITLENSSGRSLIQATLPSGQPSWTYQRNLPLCVISTAWGKVVATYRNGKEGCGDIVSIDGATGTYGPTRSAQSPQEVVSIASNDNVGTYGSTRLELWRSDLVRTVEYGMVYAPQEPDMQPHSGCTLTSALTRKNLLALTETCQGNSYLRFQKTVPEDARKPEMLADVSIPPNARLVAVGESSAAIHTGTEIISYEENGALLKRSPAQPAPVMKSAALFAPQTQDLKHYMTWFDGKRLYLFDPQNLAVVNVIEGAVGTGIDIDDKLLLPTAEGIAILVPDTGARRSLIPRPHSKPTSLALAGYHIIEKSDGVVTALEPDTTEDVPATEKP